MWPKLLLQLVEFLPHATRLLPVADRYLQANGTNERTTEAVERTGQALAATERAVRANGQVVERVAERLDDSLGKVARAHTEMAAGLDAFRAEVAEIGADAKRTRRASDLVQTRVDALEKQVAGMQRVMLAGMAVIVALLLAVLAIEAWRAHAGMGP